MPKRTSLPDARWVETADDLVDVVQDKREGWRATAAKARRRQRSASRSVRPRTIVRGRERASPKKGRCLLQSVDYSQCLLPTTMHGWTPFTYVG